MDLLKSLQHPWLIWVSIYLNIEKITPEESFTDAYVKEVYESEHVCTATKKLHAISDSK